MGLICKQCYRSEPEIEIKKNVTNESTDMCKVCYDIIGKGGGYDNDTYSNEEADKWFEGIEKRKAEYEKQKTQPDMINELEKQEYIDKFKKELLVVDIKKLSPNLWNPNRHGQESFMTLINSIKKFGFNDPVSVRQIIKEVDDYEIIDGEHRWKAAKEIGYNKISVINFGEITKEEAMTLTQLLNHKGKNDALLKAKLLKELKEKQQDLFSLLPETEKEKDEWIKLLDFDFSQFEQTEQIEKSETEKDLIKKAKNKAMELQIILDKIHDKSNDTNLRTAIEQFRTFVTMLKSYMPG